MKLTVLLQAPHKNEISISTYNLSPEIAKLVLVFFKTEAKLKFEDDPGSLEVKIF